jgi:crotonobetaine/carnitine-CoA ligase
MRRFSVSRYWPVVRDHDVTVLFGIASTASLLLKAPPTDLDREHQVRLAIHVGIPAPLHAELVSRWGVWTPTAPRSPRTSPERSRSGRPA